MVESWLDKKEGEKVKGKIPKGYVWGMQEAKKVSRKGKAMGGILMGIKRELWEKGEKIEVSREGIIVGRIKERKRSWRIVEIYVKDNMGEMLQELERWMGKKER